MATMKFLAIVSGALMAQWLPHFFEKFGLPVVRAAWCWKAAANANPDSLLCSTTEIGKGACGVAETCCGDYVCFLAGQCVGGAPDWDDVFLNERPRQVDDGNCPTPAPPPTPPPTSAPTSPTPAPTAPTPLPTPPPTPAPTPPTPMPTVPTPLPTPPTPAPTAPTMVPTAVLTPSPTTPMPPPATPMPPPATPMPEMQTPAPAPTMTCGDVKQAYKEQKCCGQPEKSFQFPSGRRMAASTDADDLGILSLVEEGLKHAQLKGAAEAQKFADKIRATIQHH